MTKEIAEKLQKDDQSALIDILHLIPPIWNLAFVNNRLLNKIEITSSSVDQPNPDLEEILAKTLAQIWVKRKTLDLKNQEIEAYIYLFLRKEIRHFKRIADPCNASEPIDLRII